MEIHSGSKALEAPCGKRYAPARGMRVNVSQLCHAAIQCNRDKFGNDNDCRNLS